MLGDLAGPAGWEAWPALLLGTFYKQTLPGHRTKTGVGLAADKSTWGLKVPIM